MNHRVRRRKVHQRADRAARPLHRPRFQQLRQREQEDDRGRFRPLAERHGAADGHHHQDVDVEHTGPYGNPGAAGRMNAGEHDGGRKRQPAEPANARDETRQQACGEQHPGSHHEPCTRARVRGWLNGRFVLQPRSHAGARHRFGDTRRRQDGGVVLHTKALGHDVGVERFQPRQPLQRALENRHLLVAIHALDLEHRLRVNLADGALGGHRVPPSCTCVIATRISCTMCWSSSV